MILKNFTLNTVLCLSIATLFGCGSSGADNSSSSTDNKVTQESIGTNTAESDKAEFENDISVVDEVNLQLSWTDNSNNEIEFIIERRTVDDVDYGTTYYVTENITTFKDIQLVSGETYCYRISASNNYGNSPSSEVCVDL